MPSEKDNTKIRLTGGKTKPYGMDDLRNYTKKMSPKQIATRKRTTISNAAQKVFNSKYSK